MSVSIRECQVDQEFRDAIPCASIDERTDLQVSIDKFGYLSPIIAWKNERGEFVILDGHNRWESWRASIACNSTGLAASEPAVVVLDLPSREDAMLFVINSQLGRRNIADIDRIALVSKREEILRRKAKGSQSAAGKQTMLGKFSDVLLALAPKAGKPINTRKELADEANVGEHTYDAGKAILDAVANGQLLPEIVEDIRNGNETIHGVAKSLKAKPARKAKSSGWQTIVSGFTAAVRKFIKRDPQRRAEIAAELRRLADEFEVDQKAAA